MPRLRVLHRRGTRRVSERGAAETREWSGEACLVPFAAGAFCDLGGVYARCAGEYDCSCVVMIGRAKVGYLGVVKYGKVR